MRSARHLLFLVLCVASLSFSLLGWLPSPAFAATNTPNELVIARTPGLNNVSNSSREVVLHALLVQQLYIHTLSLPAAPTGQICPQYLIASYRLTFFHNFTSVLQVKAVNGLCHPVILANGDVRAADSTFWKLLEQAQDAGINLSTGQSLPGNHQLFVPAHPSSQNQLP
jgi:hypothetical protein